MPSASMAKRKLTTTMAPWLQDIHDELPPLLTVEETAEVLRCAPETVRIACRSGELRAVQPVGGRGGSRYRIPRAAVIDWLRQRETHQP